jgi:hypothetical protein
MAISLAVGAVTRLWRLWRKFAQRLGYINGLLLLFTVVQCNLGMLFHHHSMIISIELLLSGQGAAGSGFAGVPGVSVKVGNSRTASHRFD